MNSKFLVKYLAKIEELGSLGLKIQDENEKIKSHNLQNQEAPKPLIDVVNQLNAIKPQWFKNLESKLDPLDIQKEFELIMKKESKLSRTMRDVIVNIISKL